MFHALDRIQLPGRTAFVRIVFALGVALCGCVPVSPEAPPSPEVPPAPVMPAAPAPPRPPAPPLPVVAGPPTRSFYMGFELWPADLSDEGLRVAQDFAYAHGDIVSVVLIGGVPWPEALD